MSERLRAGVFAVFCTVLAALAMLAPAAPAHAQAAPLGSYLQSCTVVSYSPQTKVLKANCADGKSGGAFTAPTPTSLATAPCRPNTIENDYGHLRCRADADKADGQALPEGSYIQSCEAMSVAGHVLRANCHTGGGNNKQHSELFLLQCDPKQDIMNNFGQLVCAPNPKGMQAAPPVGQGVERPWQAVLNDAGCKGFLGRADDFLCTGGTGFLKCESFVDQHKLSKCRAPGYLSSDCRTFLGRKNEYMCTTVQGWDECQKWRLTGKPLGWSGVPIAICRSKEHPKGEFPEKGAFPPSGVKTK